MEFDKEAVGKRIKQIRKDKGLTLEEFGQIIDGAGKSIVSKWERGLTLPNTKRLKLIAKVGGYDSVYELLYGERNAVIKLAINHALTDFTDSSKQRKYDYEKNKKRYEAFINNLYEKYSNYGEDLLPSHDLYFQIRRSTSNELENEYLRGSRTKESSLLYLRSILEDAHVTISKYEHDPLTQEAIKSGEIPQSVFRFVIHRLMDIKKELTNQLNEVNKQ